MLKYLSDAGAAPAGLKLRPLCVGLHSESVPTDPPVLNLCVQPQRKHKASLITKIDDSLVLISSEASQKEPMILGVLELHFK